MNSQHKKVVETLDKIVSSNAFLHSDLYVYILRFLVDSYLSDSIVKETIIEDELERNYSH